MKVDRKYRSPYYDLRNQTLNWLPGDTLELYKKNCKNQYSLLDYYGWIDYNFTYKFNSHGFRCEEFSDEPTIMTLGCSHTVGIGLPVESIWPELLAKKLNMKCANLGVGGGSLDVAFRMSLGYIDIIKPKIVVLLSPEASRLELFYYFNHKTISYLLGSWTSRYSSTDREYNNIVNFMKTWWADDNNSYFNKQKNILAIKQICDSRKIKFICKNSDSINNSEGSLARDLMHPGKTAHVLLMEKFLLDI
jgi:hypothetical protein